MFERSVEHAARTKAFHSSSESKEEANKSFGAGGRDSVTTFCGLAVSNSYTPLTADLSLSLLVILY